MKTMIFSQMRQLTSTLRAVGVFLLLLAPMSTWAEDRLPFTIYFFGNDNTPSIRVTNDARVRISNVKITIGRTDKHFDGASVVSHPSGGSVSIVTPSGDQRKDTIEVNLSGFDPGEQFTISTDIDDDGDGNSGENYRKVLFNNPADYSNSVVTVEGTINGTTVTDSLTLPDTGSADDPDYLFTSGPRPRILKVASVVEPAPGESEAIHVFRVTVKAGSSGDILQSVDGTAGENVGTEKSFRVYDGEDVQITAPSVVWKDIVGRDITSIITNDSEAIQTRAEERLTALGFSVNDVAQTGDPTLFQFEVDGDTEVVAKWRHEFAVTFEHNFTQTQSVEIDSSGTPWAGPLNSESEGNPNPSIKKHWIAKGESLIAQLDGQVLDLSRPTLDIRYVPRAFEAFGSANKNTSPLQDRTAVTAFRDAFINPDIDLDDPADNGLDDPTIRLANIFSSNEFPFTVGQSPPLRQQIPQFTVYGPALVRYVWQIQYGVRMNVDNPARAALPKIFRLEDGVWMERANLEGVFWFNPASQLRIGTAANESGETSAALNGWLNGDGYYFSSSGEIDSITGDLAVGGPVSVGDSPVGQWVNAFSDPTSGATYRLLEIPDFQRPARVQWTYGEQGMAVNVTVGEHVFQDDPISAALFTNRPDDTNITVLSSPDPNLGPSEMVSWDNEAKRLYPLIEGRFRVRWQPTDSSDLVDITVDVSWPDPPHYEHVVGAPPVALDPDPDDDFAFAELHYTDAEAAVDGESLFTASGAGRTVLLFDELQRDGRGETRAFQRVRVVESKLFSSDLQNDATDHERIVGTKIEDTELDKARLGTGFIMSIAQFNDVPDIARYNPFVYDVELLTGLASGDIYDLTALRSDAADPADRLVVTNRENLPGPIIPVNLHPGAAENERIIVVWYDDPTENDGLMWPYRARKYVPRWPRATDPEPPGRIVIASQWGSESLASDGSDQEVVPGEVSYNPATLQRVQIYSQNDPAAPGYNPNEEHALMAPSLRYADISPRPPAAYALRDNDLNAFDRANSDFDEQQETDNDYTSHPFVLVQYFDVEAAEYRMRVYSVVKEDTTLDGHYFPTQGLGTTASLQKAPTQLRDDEPFIVMEAGEPVIPFYPLGVVNGASPCPQTKGRNLIMKESVTSSDTLLQNTYWEDHKGTNWAVAGGDLAWFTVSNHYRLLPDFWWPVEPAANVDDFPLRKPGFITETRSAEEDDGSLVETVVKTATRAEIGDCVSFLPTDINELLDQTADAELTTETITDGTSGGVTGSTDVLEAVEPTEVLYKSDWPKVAPVLKAGETMTFQGGEYRGDQPTTPFIDEDGVLREAETPGLPGIVAFAAAEVVFDSLNPTGNDDLWKASWTARVAQVLDIRSVNLSIDSFPPELKPASGRSRVSQGKYVFNDLPASLQKRIRYDPLAQFETTVENNAGEDVTITVTGRLEIHGFLNDKGIGDATLTAAPPAVYILEPNILTEDDVNTLKALDDDSGSLWDAAVQSLYNTTRNPDGITGATAGDYLVGLEREIIRNTETGLPELEAIEPGSEVMVPKRRSGVAAPLRAFGPGLALIPNSEFLNPEGEIPAVDSNPARPYPEISWVTVVENNDPSLGGSPVTPHVIKVDRRQRYRGAIKTVVSDNVFDENLVLRHTGDFGANPENLVFEWWYRPDDGSVDVPPFDLLESGQTNPWFLFPDPSGRRGERTFEITLKGNPNAPETLLADTWWFVRYRHVNDEVDGINWDVEQKDADGDTIADSVNFTWAGAGNSDPFNDFDGDGLPDYRAQLAQGWIKRVLDAVNPYEARISQFEGDSPATDSSMISLFGPRFEGAVALNPAKNVIENVGLIELYETVLNRGRSLSIDLSRPVATPAIFNALQLASTRISDFYTILGNEAFTDALDHTIGFGSDSVEYGSLAPAVYAFQNQMPTLMDEELALLRGVDDFFARPVYNRLFWNFTKGEGEAAYANTYNVSDINLDGFINEDDAMELFPQGHGDAWGHYLTALRNQYDLLKHRFFNWVSRSESYNLQDIVISVDFLDERKFARTAAAKAKTGAEIVDLTYRSRYVQDPQAQWQGYTDTNKDRAWGVQGWARRAGQGAYFDWVTANALLPAVHPNEELEGIQKVDRTTNSDIATIAANANAVQRTFDDANKGRNPLGLEGNVVPFDVDPANIPVGQQFVITYFDQIYERAVKALENAVVTWNNANESRNMLRRVANNELDFRNSVFQEDVSYRNRLIKIFGTPYEGTIGPGQVYPAGYDGPDTQLFMYVDVREINQDTVPGPTTAFATFSDTPDDDGYFRLTDGDIYDAWQANSDGGGRSISTLDNKMRKLFSPTFYFPADDEDERSLDGTPPASFSVKDGWYNVNYTDVVNPKVPLEGFSQLMPVKASGYTFQAPNAWGSRRATGELQVMISKMIQQEAQVASAIGAWDALAGEIGRQFRLTNAQLETGKIMFDIRESFNRLKYIYSNGIKIIETGLEINKGLKNTVEKLFENAHDAIPADGVIAGFSYSVGDVPYAPLRVTVGVGELAAATPLSALDVTGKIAKLVADIAFDVTEQELELYKARLESDQSKREALKALEDLVGDEPVLRINVFREIQALSEMSDSYRTLVNEGFRLLDERMAFNRRVAAQTQRNRYQDMTFRVSRNHALQNYREAFDLAARYAYLAAKAYDYETNFAPEDAGSPREIFNQIVKARGLGLVSGGPQFGNGGLAEALAWLKTNYESQKGQLGINNPQAETGKLSLRTERYRILPKGSVQPDIGDPQFIEPGADSDALWEEVLRDSVVPDLWQIPEYRYFCRPFASPTDSGGNHVRQPGLVMRFGTEITAGKNFFGKPLSGADHGYDPSNFATKISSVGVWFSDYLSDDVTTDLSETARVYLLPTGTDVMTVPTAGDPSIVRLWNIVDQSIPVPLPSATSDLDNGNYIPLLDSLNGRLGEPRRFSSFRAYHNGSDAVDTDQLVFNTRLIGRSVWNTQWILIIPGLSLNANAEEGLERFVSQVSDIKLVFQTYGHSGS